MYVVHGLECRAGLYTRDQDKKTTLYFFLSITTRGLQQALIMQQKNKQDAMTYIPARKQEDLAKKVEIVDVR